MESPPYMPPQRRSTPWVWIILGGVLLCCILPVGLLVGGGFWAFNQVKDLGACMINFQDAQKALLTYASKHDGKLPKAESWQDDVREDFRKSMAPQQQMGPIQEMSPDGEWGCRDPKGVMSGMAFNSDLSGKKLNDIGDQVSTIMIFETEHPSKNLHEAYKPRDFLLSPITIGGAHRGWIETPVSGSSVMVGQNGQRNQVNMAPRPAGVNVQVNGQ